MEIPVELRKNVKLAIAETGLLGPVGAFSSVADIANIGGWWGWLLVKYSKHYGIKVDEETAKKLCMAALTGLGGYYAGCKVATRLFNLVPGAGTLAAMGLSSFENVIFTYRFAVTLTRIFESGSVNMDIFAESVKIIFAGTGQGFLNVRDIVNLFITN